MIQPTLVLLRRPSGALDGLFCILIALLFLHFYLQSVLHDIDTMREDYLHLKEHIMKELEDTSDPDKAQFLRSEIPIINHRLASLEGSSSAHLQR